MQIRFLICLITLPLVGCSVPLTENQCTPAGQYSVGVSYGRDGYGAGKFSRMIEDCAEFGVFPDRDSWERGRQAGLLQYCTPDKAYEIGKRNNTINNVCTPTQRAEMRDAYLVGQRHYQLTQRISALQHERNGLREQLDSIAPSITDEDRKDIRRRLRQINKRIDRLDDLRILNSFYR